MFAYVVRRLWQMLPTMAGVILLVFLLFNWVGGDPAFILAGKMANADDIASIRRQLKLLAQAEATRRFINDTPLAGEGGPL